MDEERGARDGERERQREPPPAAVQLAAQSPSSAAPASIIACAQALWATMWIVELVKKTITGHISTPSPKSRLGQR